MKNKKAEFNMKILTNLVIAMIIFALVLTVGIVLMDKLGDTMVSCASGITNEVVTEEVGWINSTTYTLANAGRNGFTSPAITALRNLSSGKTIVSANATLSASGIIVNATSIQWNNVSINYTYTWNDAHTWNTTTQTCLNASGGDAETGQGTGYTSTAYMSTQMNSTSGLASWTPAIIALVIGLIFIGAFMARRGKKY